MNNDTKLNILCLKIKKLTLEMIRERGFGHLGGSFSIIETLTVLFGKIMNINPDQPNDPSRDYFVLSKGHAGPAYYSTLAACGYFPEATLMTLNKNETCLPSHPDRNKTIGVDCTTGSLGQGISQAAGIAYGFKIQNKSNRVFCIIGDGECNEGQVWEAIQFIQNKKLDNLILLVDNNKQQVDGFTEDISFKYDFNKLFDSLGYYVQEVNGQSLKAIEETINKALEVKDKAKVIILNTIKAQSLPHYENKIASHHLKLSTEDKAYFQLYIDEFTNEMERLANEMATR